MTYDGEFQETPLFSITVLTHSVLTNIKVMHHSQASLSWIIQCLDDNQIALLGRNWKEMKRRTDGWADGRIGDSSENDH